MYVFSQLMLMTETICWIQHTQKIESEKIVEKLKNRWVN